MGLETANYLADLQEANPAGGDDIAQGDDHIRMMKLVLKNTFPGRAGASMRYLAKSSTFTAGMTEIDSVYNCSAAVTMNLPAVAGVTAGTFWYVYAANGDVTVDGSGSEQVNGGLTATILSGELALVIYNGTNWHMHKIVQVSGVTQTAGDNSTKLATTAFVANAVSSVDLSTRVAKAGDTMTGTLVVSTAASAYALDGKTTVASYGGVIGRSADGSKYAVLGYNNAQGVYSVGDIYGSANITAYSDRRVKKNLTPIAGALERIGQLTGYVYDRTDCELRQTGLVAQELLEVLPEAVTQDEATGHYGIAYGQLAGLFVQAINELRRKVEELEDRHGV